MPDSTSVSGIFGVSYRRERQQQLLTASPTASSDMSFAPLVATITGSTTMFSARY
jgi:hypothetical protein